MTTRKSNIGLAYGSMIIGIAAMPVSAFINIPLGLGLGLVSFFMILAASDPS